MTKHKGENGTEGIAIIGISGFFPGSDSIEDFCRKIENQESLFSPAPENHFPGPNMKDRFGAFLNEIDSFDPEVFNIGPLEAQYMDPRTRLLLMSVWQTLEDACYLPSQISASRVDVYIASEGSAYTPYLAKAKLSAYSILGMMSWSLPNYISHAFKLKGKSLYIDTACSGASVALHQAMHALQTDETDYAIVGASNLLFGDALAGSYKGQESLGILGGVNTCYPFQKNAKGFLPAEATVTVLLKKLSEAVRDKDNIHGILLGSHVNHSGGYGTLTMPSAESQAEAIVRAYCNSGIDPATVTYIEAHGASSLLADAEEIKGFKKADIKLKDRFKHTSDQACKISTIKPNIGHANSASGLISLVRTLHAFKIGKKFGIKNFSEASDKIDLEGTRFYINEKTEPWERLVGEGGAEVPRRAAINNFGAGGVNVHLILEESVPAQDQEEADPGETDVDKVYFLALSAMHEEQWVPYASAIRFFLKQNNNIRAEVLEYLYLTKRTSFKNRVVLRYKSIENLQQKLDRFITSGGQKSYYLKSDPRDSATSLDIFRRYSKFSDFLKTLSQDSDKSVLMELWVRGIDFPADQFFKGSTFIKQSLPRYPFKKDRFWADTSLDNSLALNWGAQTPLDIHPLLHKNTSNFHIQRYSSTFTGEEFFLDDHVVQGKKVLPGVAYLEIARAAVENASGDMEQANDRGFGVTLKNVVWIRPLVVGDAGLKVHIELKPEDGNLITFEIYSAAKREAGQRVIHCRGQAVFPATAPAVERLNVSELKAQCRGKTISPDDCYKGYKAMDIYHGPAFQGVDIIYQGENQALAKISLPACVVETRHRFLLHPSLMDSVLQMAVGLIVDTDNPEFALPFALEALEVLHQCPTTMWVWARFKEGSSRQDKVKKVDFDLCDEEGNICVRLRGFSSRVLSHSSVQSAPIDQPVAQTRHISPSTKIEIAEAEAGEENPGYQLDFDDLRAKVLAVIKKSLAALRNLNPNQIDLNTELSSYGLDSILLTDFTNQMNRQYQLELTPTVFFEHPTLADFVDYLLEEHRAVFVSQFSGFAEKRHPVELESDKNTGVDTGLPANGHGHTDDIISRFATSPSIQAENKTAFSDSIAIVGVSGRFPMARDVNAFWENLKSGRDCISEIPKDRWDWQAFYGDPVREVNKSNVKWGGFMDGVDEFDPLFFGISPKEAELMDPQQRLLMIYVWSAIEDAGYSAAALSGTATGIFVGTGMSGYSSLIAEARLPIEGYSLTGVVPSVGPNRMSFFLDVHGPSEPIETACSSSLIAIHRAVQAMEKGDCDQVIVGGVNTLVTPDGYISFSKAGMLCEDGRCKTFSNRANGYVRGEGVGMLFLKKLSDAEAAGDHIYGLIRSSAENHGGRANSLTAPNPKAQTALLKHAYTKAGVDPRSVGYIEAHGTGTELGDPIEINGLKSAFKDLYRAVPSTEETNVSEAHCGLGSVKSNIGHLEMAAGIAGVIKVLLQLKHKTLVKSLHCDSLNPYIQLKDSPFYVVQENRPWVAPKDRQGKDLPRRAGVSSFGFGGANAHVVLEEYLGRPEKMSRIEGLELPGLVVLSAKNEARLKVYAKNLLVSITADNEFRPRLSDLAYTLQVGRDAMDERLGLIAESVDALAEKLQGYLQGREDVDELYRGNVRKNKEILATFATDEDIAGIVDTWIHKRKYSKLLDMWVKGLPVDWIKIYAENRPRRISLPTYPFATDRYWIERDKSAAAAPQARFADLPEPANENTGRSISSTRDIIKEDLSYIALWEQCKPQLDDAGGFARTKGADQNILIVSSTVAYEFEKTIQSHYLHEPAHKRVIYIRLADETRQIEENTWSCSVDDIKGLETCLEKVEQIHCVYFLAAFEEKTQKVDEATLARSQQQNEMQLLRLVKLLQHKTPKDASMDLTILTQDNYQTGQGRANPYGGGVSGLGYAIAQGDHRLRVRNIDLSRQDLIGKDKQEKLFLRILMEPPTDRGDIIKFKSGRRYKQVFFRLDWGAFKGDSGITRGGVYVILGGSGTVGRIMTRHLIRDYQAKIVWLGRQEESASSIQEKLRAMGEEGARPLYIQADATNPSALKAALTDIKSHYTTINGAIFAGVVFDAENSINRTTEEDFWNILNVKTSGSYNFYHAFKGEPLNFMCYFSSSQAFSFSGAANLSAYAAGITFSDTLIRSLQSSSTFPVGIINWGFWLASLQGLPANHSVHALKDREGFRCFEQFTCALQEGVLNQALCLNASGPVQQLMNVRKDESVSLCRQSLAGEKLINEYV